MEKIKGFISRYSRLLAFCWALLLLFFLYHFSVFEKIKTTIVSKRNDLATKHAPRPWIEKVDSTFTNNIRTRFYETNESENHFNMEGWAFKEPGNQFLDDSLELVLESSTNQRWIAPLYRFQTPDVVEYFNKSELIKSGFGISMIKNNLKNGVYRTALLFRNKITNFKSIYWLDYQIVVSRETPPALIERPSEKVAKLQYSIYSIDNNQKNIRIVAWAFPADRSCINCKVYFTLGSHNFFYAAEAIREPRPDVVSFFNDPSVLYSGIEVTIVKESLQKNSYKLGILMKDSIRRVEYFSETDNLVHIGLDSLAVPEVLSTIPQGADTIRTFIDSLTDTEDFVQIQGWAFINNLSTDFSETMVVLKSEEINYSLASTPNLRSDIQGYFKLSYNVDLAGFTIKFKKAHIKSGEYQLCIMMLNKKTNTKSLQCLDTSIKI